MTPIRVSFVDEETGRRKRGRVLQFVSRSLGPVVALVEVDGKIVQMNPRDLKVLRGRW